MIACGLSPPVFPPEIPVCTDINNYGGYGPVKFFGVDGTITYCFQTITQPGPSDPCLRTSTSPNLNASFNISVNSPFSLSSPVSIDLIIDETSIASPPCGTTPC